MRRELGQLSLADGLVEGGAGRNRQLERIAALVDWAAFECLLGEVYAAPVGRPSYGPVVLLKCLLLQQWYRLSDPGLEEALSDRLSFRRFVGLALADPVPDHSTLSRFRSELSRRGLAERLLAELNRQLDARGLMVKAGTLIDASLVAADCRRPHKGEPVDGAQRPGCELERDAGAAAVRLQDAPRGRPGLGPGATSDPHSRPRLGQGCRSSTWSRATSGRCTPTSGYDGAWYRARLLEQGIADGIMAGDYRQRPLDAAGHARNRTLGAIRAPVERTFAILKRYYGYARVRYRSLIKNALQLQLLAVALNLRRALVLSALRADSASTIGRSGGPGPKRPHLSPSSVPSRRLLAVLDGKERTPA